MGVTTILTLALTAAFIMFGRHPDRIRFAEANGVVVSKYMTLPYRSTPSAAYHLRIKGRTGEIVELHVSSIEYRTAGIGSSVSLARPGTVISR